MINIPENNSADLIAKKEAKRQAELDLIATQFLNGLKKYDTATVECSEHMIGYHGSTEYHHLHDTLEVARQFKAKGYYCYYYDYYNSYNVNQRAVCVCKAPKSESEIHRRTWSWQSV